MTPQMHMAASCTRAVPLAAISLLKFLMSYSGSLKCVIDLALVPINCHSSWGPRIVPESKRVYGNETDSLRST